MDIIELLKSGGAGDALEALAKSHGLTQDQLNAIIGKIGPALSNRIERNTLSRGGLAETIEETARPEHAKMLADPAHVTTAAATSAGTGALETIFGAIGSKDQSRAVAAQAAMSSGVEQAIIQKLLPIIASLVMAALSKGMQGGLGDILKKLPDLAGAGGGNGGSSGSFPQPAGRRRAAEDQQQDEQQDQSAGDDADQPEPARPARRSEPAGGLGDILNKIPGFPGSQPQTAPMPAPGNRQPPSDDNSFGGGPLPIPGDRIPGVNAAYSANPYGNLSDVIRQGGHMVDGDPLSQAVRNTLGNALGFQSKGILSWIVQLIVMRWGVGLLRGLLGRMAGGR